MNSGMEAIKKVQSAEARAKEIVAMVVASDAVAACAVVPFPVAVRYI